MRHVGTAIRSTRFLPMIMGIVSITLVRSTSRYVAAKATRADGSAGRLEVDPNSEVWIDYEEETFGDPYLRREESMFEDGFMMSCCDRARGAKGCCKDRHRQL